MDLDRTLPIGAYKTYVIAQPLATHFRHATCAEIECPGYLNGWVTVVPSDSPQAVYIRTGSKRHFVEQPAGAGLAEFRFAAGQRCFGAERHKVPVGRPPLYVVRDGDRRGNPTGRQMQHATPEDWRDDLGEHQLKIIDARQKG